VVRTMAVLGMASVVLMCSLGDGSRDRPPICMFGIEPRFLGNLDNGSPVVPETAVVWV